jgi:SAM-dependent methyltransferase
MTLGSEHFERLYAASPDPWGFRTRWYERRKRAVTMAALPCEHYQNAFEPGCSIGTLTARLAPRCQALLAVDATQSAVDEARTAVAAYPHVQVRRMAVPDEWPDGPFDLVVVSEIGYYFDVVDLRRLAERAVESLVDGGTLLACHWRHPVADYPLTGDVVHDALGADPALVATVRHVEADFRLEVWTKGVVDSVARREGLL